ncbi:MAG: hypothetical protein RIC85_02970 [Gammaproteobacteria bacterium]
MQNRDFQTIYVCSKEDELLDTVYLSNKKRQRAVFTTRLIGKPYFKETPLQDVLNLEEGGVALFGMGRNMENIDVILRTLRVDVLEELRRKRISLVFDHSGEGMTFKSKRCENWHIAINEFSLEDNPIVLWTQSRLFSNFYNDWANKNGITKKIFVDNYDYHIKRLVTQSWRHPRIEFEKRLAKFEKKDQISKDFVCLNFKPRPWRLMFLAHLMRDNLFDRGFVSFGGIHEEAFSLTGRSKLWSDGRLAEQLMEIVTDEDILPYLEQVIQMKPSFISENMEDESDSFGKGRPYDQLHDIYDKSLFTVVTETEMTNYKNRVTEKPFKAIANAHPLIILGNFASLEVLEEFGFQCYHPWIYEHYDEIEDPHERFIELYNTFRDLLERARGLLFEDQSFRRNIIENLENVVVNLPFFYRNTLDRKLAENLRAVMTAPVSDP